MYSRTPTGLLFLVLAAITFSLAQQAPPPPPQTGPSLGRCGCHRRNGSERTLSFCVDRTNVEPSLQGITVSLVRGR